MKKILILTVIFLVSVNMIGQNFFSQQLVSSGGDQTDNATYKTSWSIGEPITETATAGAYTLTQGFQQQIYPQLVAGTISASQAICYNTAPAQLTGTAPTGGLMPYTYQWQNSPNGTVWTDIASATNLNYQPPALTALTYYRLKQTSSGGNGIVITNTVTITINALPVPTLAGPNPVCAQSSGNVYTTQTGMTNYVWTVSAGGIITAGGTSSSNTVTVTWNTAGAQTVSVNYTNSNGCTASQATVYNVTVYPLPLPWIGIWNNNPCVGSEGNQFYTETGMFNYVWTVTGGGQITAGQGTDNISVTWILPGIQTISVTFTNANGCTADPPGTYLTMVDSYPNPAGNITGSSSVCAGENGVAYSINPVASATSYTWTLPSGASIATGSGTNDITVNFSVSATSGNITVAGTNDCGSGTSSPPFAVTVNPLPAAAGTITGTDTVCQGDMDVPYSVPIIANATDYVWSLPPGAGIASGTNTNQITVNFSESATSGVVNVYGTNACGSGAVSTNFNVTVSPIPATPVITVSGTILTSSAPAGNQWYFNGTAIPGAADQTYEATASGDYYVIVTLNGCSSDPSNVITVIMTGINNSSANNLNIYPVPNDGRFTISFTCSSDEIMTLEVYNYLGARIHTSKVHPIQRKVEQIVDLRPVPSGVYTIVLRTEDNRVIRRILINK